MLRERQCHPVQEHLFQIKHLNFGESIATALPESRVRDPLAFFAG
ncbi:MAG: hypothetical protein ACR2G5_16695 [Pyrinomonadaceae bacterium]